MSASLRLLTALAETPDIILVANPVLLQEWRRNAGPSRTAQALVEALAARCQIVMPDAAALAATRAHFRPGAAADWLHAATCLGAGAVLVSNDRDFGPVAQAGLVEVWTVGRLLRHLGLDA